MARRSQGLSERHRKIMEFLTKFQEDNGYSPSIRQIGDSIDVKSTSLVDYYLNQLQEMGYIEREDRISRSIRVQQPVYSSPSITAMKPLIRGSIFLTTRICMPMAVPRSSCSDSGRSWAAF